MWKRRVSDAMASEGLTLKTCLQYINGSSNPPAKLASWLVGRIPIKSKACIVPCTHTVNLFKLVTLVSGIAREPHAAGLDGFEKVAEFASYSEENRRFLANLHDSVEAILRVLIREGERVEVLESALRILDLILLENGVRERILRLIFRTDYERCFDSILLVLRKGTLRSKIQSSRILEMIASNPDSRRTIGHTVDNSLKLERDINCQMLSPNSFRTKKGSS
ncbi:hypothetical protein SAY87_024612 [Trapa incisa]|uniref:U-box domain-containing protein n=1 Tax=Trapa incisa TaxID=236973 RepID=A0AAN7JF85_9MYRT|nr:hypothetical protein SAY87_024612 [Trapa incisa]